MAQISDERLPQLAEVVHAKKVTPAAIRVVDVPGTGAQLLGNLRQVDALLAVLDDWSGTRDPAGDLETLGSSSSSPTAITSSAASTACRSRRSPAIRACARRSTSSSGCLPISRRAVRFPTTTASFRPSSSR